MNGIDRAAAERDQAIYWRHPRFDGMGLLKARFRRHRYALHTHPTYVVALITGGCERVRIGRGRADVPAASVIVVNPEECHDGEARLPGGLGLPDLLPDHRHHGRSRPRTGTGRAPALPARRHRRSRPRGIARRGASRRRARRRGRGGDDAAGVPPPHSRPCGSRRRAPRAGIWWLRGAIRAVPGDDRGRARGHHPARTPRRGRRCHALPGHPRHQEDDRADAGRLHPRPARAARGRLDRARFDGFGRRGGGRLRGSEPPHPRLPAGARLPARHAPAGGRVPRTGPVRQARGPTAYWIDPAAHRPRGTLRWGPHEREYARAGDRPGGCSTCP